MARNFPADTRGQRCLEELYEKEARAQLIWFLKSEKAKKDNPGKTLTPAAILETPIPKLEEALPTSLLEKVRQIQQSIEKPKEVTPVKGVTDAQKQFQEPEPDMFPPDKPTQLILYDGISKEGRGRSKYLTTRKKLDLEDKYRYPVLSSMEYGWGQTELIKQTGAAQKRKGRVKIVEESFYRRNGIPFQHCDEML